MISRRASASWWCWCSTNHGVICKGSSKRVLLSSIHGSHQASRASRHQAAEQVTSKPEREKQQESKLGLDSNVVNEKSGRVILISCNGFRFRPLSLHNA